MNTVAQAPDTMIEPFVKLATANTDLLRRFATSPEVTAEAVDTTAAVVGRLQKATMSLSTSSAAGSLVEGLMNNYLQFWIELAGTMAAAWTPRASTWATPGAAATASLILPGDPRHDSPVQAG